MRYKIDYDEEITRSNTANVVCKENVYDYRETPYEGLFGSYYSFCRSDLNEHSETESIFPNVFLFSNSFEINAGAGIKNEHFVITVNLGLLRSCAINYHENEQLDRHFAEVWPDTVKNYDVPIRVLAFQVCSNFTYYHELAHLFQYSRRNAEFELKERKSIADGSGYSYERHALEINADTYASVSVAAHIEQYISKAFGEEVNEEFALNTITIVGCCLLNYLLSFSDQGERLYFEEHTHPHPFLRLSNSLLVIANALQYSPYFIRNSVKVEGRRLFSHVLTEYRRLESIGIFQTGIEQTISNSRSDGERLAEYLHRLIQFEVEGYVDALEIWNKHAQK